MNSLKNSNNLELDMLNSSLREEFDKIDNLFEHNFRSRIDMTMDKEKKIIKKAKLYFYAQNFEFEEDRHQKQINKIISKIQKIHNKDAKKKLFFKPLLKLKKISMEHRVFYNENNKNVELKDNFNNNAINNSIKH